MSEEERVQILDDNIQRGNHKSALTKEDRHHVTKLIRQDVELGYAVPISLECITNLKGVEVYPIRLQSQLMINETEYIGLVVDSII